MGGGGGGGEGLHNLCTTPKRLKPNETKRACRLYMQFTLMRLVGTMTGTSFNCAIKPQILQIKWIKQVKIHQSEKKV